LSGILVITKSPFLRLVQPPPDQKNGTGIIYSSNPNRRVDHPTDPVKVFLGLINHMEGDLSMFYGIDLHTDSFKVAQLTYEGNKPTTQTVSLKNESFHYFLSKLTKDDYVVVEASTNTFWFVEQLQSTVKEVYVVDPYRFSSATKSNKKTDKVDALKLVRKLKYYVLFDKSQEEFPTIYIPDKEIIDLRSMFTTYEQIKKQVTMTKNRIRSLLRQNGIFNFSKKDLSGKSVQHELLSIDLPDALAVQFRILLSVLNVQLQEKENIKREILKKGQCFYKEISLLTSIRGVSPFLAIAIMSDIADINRFQNAKKLCAYLRTAPKIESSSNTRHIGKVNKQSRTLSMSLMTESVKHFAYLRQRSDDSVLAS
jgi:transposase